MNQVSRQSIKDYIVTLLSCINNPEYAKRTSEELMRQIDDDKDLEKIMDRLISIDMSSVRSPVSYLKKVFLNGLQEGTFDKQPEVIPASETVNAEYINPISLFRHLESEGIKVIPSDTAFLDVALNYIYGELHVSLNDIRELTDNIIAHVKQEPEEPSTAHFVDYLKRSDFLREKGANWQIVEDRANKANEEWAELLGQIDQLKKH